MADVVNLLGFGWYAVANSTATATTTYTDGVLIPGTALNKAATIASTTVSSIDTTAAGVKFSNSYALRSAYGVSFAGQIRARVKWTESAAAPAGATGRINVDLKRRDTSGNISAITGVTKGSGKPRALDVAQATTYTENQIVVNVPNQTLAPGESFVIVVEFEVLATSAGNSLTVALSTDAATSGNELVVEFDAGRY
jgi:hypothetical protein